MKTTCTVCGAEIPKGARFCLSCGAEVGVVTCSCGAKIPRGAEFCPSCGRPVEEGAAATMGRRRHRRRDAGIRWVRGDQSVAARVTPSDLKGRLRSGLEVQPGTRALLFLGGRYVGTLAPGRHTIESLAAKLKIPTDGEPAALIVDDGELGLAFEVTGLHSADHHDVTLVAEASLRLVEPEVFLANVMRDRATFTVDDLVEMLSGEIRQTLREMVTGHAAQDLVSGALRARLEMELLSAWKATLDRTGFALNRFRVLRFISPALEEAEDLRTDGHDGATVAEAAREAGQVLYEEDLADLRWETEKVRRTGEAELERRGVDVELEVANLEKDLERLERRQPVFKSLLEEQVLEKMTGLRSEEDWRKFRLQVDRDRVLDDHEWEELRKDLEAKAGQADVQRRFAFERLHAAAQADLDEMNLKRRYQLKLLEMRGDTDVIREQVERARLELDAELEERKKVFARQMEERERSFAQELTEQRSVAELQMWKIERMEANRQLANDREAARQLQLEVTRAEQERKRLAQLGEMTIGKSAEEIVATGILLGSEGASGGGGRRGHPGAQGNRGGRARGCHPARVAGPRGGASSAAAGTGPAKVRDGGGRGRPAPGTPRCHRRAGEGPTGTCDHGGVDGRRQAAGAHGLVREAQDQVQRSARLSPMRPGAGGGVGERPGGGDPGGHGARAEASDIHGKRSAELCHANREGGHQPLLDPLLGGSSRKRKRDAPQRAGRSRGTGKPGASRGSERPDIHPVRPL